MHDWKEELKRASHELDIPPTEEGSVSVESGADVAERGSFTQEELVKLEAILRQFEGDAHQEVVADDIQAGREGATPKEHADVQSAGEEFEEGVRALVVASQKEMSRVGSEERGESVDDQDRRRGRKRERITPTEDAVAPEQSDTGETIVSYPEDEEEKLESNPPKSIEPQLDTRESREATQQIDQTPVVATQKEPKEESLATPKLEEETSRELTRGEFVAQERGPRFGSGNKELSRAFVEAGIRVLNERGIALSTAEFVEAVEQMTNLTVSPDDYYVLYNAARTEFLAKKQKEEQPKEESQKTPSTTSELEQKDFPSGLLLIARTILFEMGGSDSYELFVERLKEAVGNDVIRDVDTHNLYEYALTHSDKNDSIISGLVERERERLFERITVLARQHPEVTNAVELIHILKAKNPEIAISDVQGLFYFAEQLIKDAKRHRGQTSESVARPEWKLSEKLKEMPVNSLKHGESVEMDEQSKEAIDTKKEITHKVFHLTVDYGRSIEDGIKAGGYDYIDSHPATVLPIREVVEETDIHLVCFNRRMTTEQVVDALDRMGLTPANSQHALAFGEHFPSFQHRIAFMGTFEPYGYNPAVMVAGGAYLYTEERYGKKNYRHLSSLDSWLRLREPKVEQTPEQYHNREIRPPSLFGSLSWHEEFYFAAVPKSSVDQKTTLVEEEEELDSSASNPPSEPPITRHEAYVPQQKHGKAARVFATLGERAKEIAGRVWDRAGVKLEQWMVNVPSQMRLIHDKSARVLRATVDEYDASIKRIKKDLARLDELERGTLTTKKQKTAARKDRIKRERALEEIAHKRDSVMRELDVKEKKKEQYQHACESIAYRAFARIERISAPYRERLEDIEAQYGVLYEKAKKFYSDILAFREIARALEKQRKETTLTSEKLVIKKKLKEIQAMLEKALKHYAQCQSELARIAKKLVSAKEKVVAWKEKTAQLERTTRPMPNRMPSEPPASADYEVIDYEAASHAREEDEHNEHEELEARVSVEKYQSLWDERFGDVVRFDKGELEKIRKNLAANIMPELREVSLDGEVSPRWIELLLRTYIQKVKEAHIRAKHPVPKELKKLSDKKVDEMVEYIRARVAL